jgi:putative transposase
MARSVKKTSAESADAIVALDPGVRTFQTYYSQQSAGKIGMNVASYIKKYQDRTDKLQCEMEFTNSKKRYAMRKRCFKLRAKAKNIVDNMQWHAANYLTDKYSVILLPKFNTRSIAMKTNCAQRNRDLYAVRHYSFREKLLHKANIKSKSVILCSEAHTSKTCTQCGNMKDDLAGDKVYICGSCGVSIDRDIAGARNILIRCLTKYQMGLDTTPQEGESLPQVISNETNRQ